ncbi:hypothetical protein [Emticicia agri]|uniref:Type 1 periplasmic binding fold superfamily protein n=1 Tax=Emticicia agri TaxID=2492393 RepID=A0A4Q5M3F1_9BACT|nr:hypothetical protein [Emticicia agri]RYU96848.1 hypothetical protein EWM59_04790 [Emticicia agri]
MQKNRISIFSYFALALLFSMAACKDTSVDIEEENEIITTVKLNFTSAGNTQTFVFNDPDGEGGNTPTKFDNITLKPNTSYTLTVELLDESKTPAENITNEVATESDEHLFVFTPSPTSLLTYTYTDKDARNFPIGLAGTVQTGAAGTGKLKVQLRHQPPVNGKEVKDGTSAPGSDDVNLDFNLTIQ